MNERIVVTCRMSGEEVGRPEARYLERARALTQQAEALGASLAAWSATTMAFAWDTESLEEAVQFACSANPPGEKTWACAIARGALEALAQTGDRGRGRADLAWGEPLVAAVILARAARAGEVVVEETFSGVDAFVATGKRVGRDGERRVRGLRIDPHHPWRRDAGADVERMKRVPFIERGDGRALLVRPGLVHVVRADPGCGGSRMLAEFARAVAPGTAILVAPTGSSVEPLGALRRGVVRALASRPYPDDPALAPVLEAFLRGTGASIEQAAALVGAFLRPRTPSEPPGALLLDDAGDIDAESLEACAQIVAWMASPFHVFVRIDATDQVPAAFGALPIGREIEVGPFDSEDATEFARSLTGGALGDRSARRVARRAGYGPLAIEEIVAYGLTTGDVVWIGDRAGLRNAASLAGKPEGADRWIARRARLAGPDERGVLATLALLGGEAQVTTLRAVLAIAEPSVAVEEQLRVLAQRRWLTQTLPGWVALPSRTHKETIADLLEEAPRRALSLAIADVMEQGEGELACAEAANHAVKGGDGERGARLALRAARAAQAAGMAKSASRLLTLARLADPKCEPLTRQQLLTSLPPPIMPPSGAPPDRAKAPPAEPPPSSTVPDASAVRRGAPAPPAPPPPVARMAKANEHDSDYPTILNARALAAPRPVNEAPPDAPSIERPTEPDPVPAYVLRPPPRAVAPPRPARASTTAPTPGGAILPKPSAPLALRPSLKAMPAVAPPRGPVSGGARPAPLLPVPQGPAARPAPPPATAPPAAPAPVVASPPDGAARAAVARMIDLAKLALVEGDAAGLDRWTEGLRASGDHDLFVDRIEAIGRITRGQVGDALRSLRVLRDGAASSGPATARAQSALALGLALAAANRSDEALLEALDALARAREAGDERATGACLAFLSKLYARLDRREDASALRTAAKR